jgi:uncharacterized membrane protein
VSAEGSAATGAPRDVRSHEAAPGRRASLRPGAEGLTVRGVSRERLLAVDAARGLALLLMVLDHAAIFARVNAVAETYAGKPVILGGPGWVVTGLLTNVSATTFWFLSGVSVALMSWRERLRNSTDDFLLIRAGVLILIDTLLVSWEWHPLAAPRVAARFDLLTCLGLSMLLMIPVRRLSDRALLILAAALFVGYAVLVRVVPDATLQRFGFPLRMLVTFDDVHPPVVTFPVMGWFGLMALGTWCGRRLADGRWQRGAPPAMAGLACLGVWLAARLTGLGSADRWQPAHGLEALVLMRRGPPALDYLAFNLSFGLLALAGLMGSGDFLRRGGPGRWLVAWGQAPLFLFVTHLLVVFASARLAMHLFRHAEVPRYLLTFAATAVVLLPIARWYRNLKVHHPNGLIRFF